VSWKKDFITAGIALALITLVSHIYEKSCVDEEVQVVQEVPSVQVAQEVGEDMSFAAFGSYQSGDSWRNLDSFGWYGTSFPFKSGSPSESFHALLSGIPTPQDPALVLEEPTDYLDDCYVWYNEATNVPYSGHANLNVVLADSGGGKVVMHIYNEAGDLMATSDPWLFTVGEDWHEFLFTSAVALTPGQKYILALGCSFSALDDIVQVKVTTNFANYVAPPPPPPPVGPSGTVLPLIKGASDMAAGNSRLIQ